MTHEERSEARNYAWCYFALHADQRIRLFNYFLVITGLILSAFTALRESTNSSKIVSILPFLLIPASFVFWRLEERTRTLVKNAEDALRFLDEQFSQPNNPDGSPSQLRLFERDDYRRKQAIRNQTVLSRAIPISYADCFRLTYLTVGVLGLGLAVWAWLSEPNTLTQTKPAVSQSTSLKSPHQHPAPANRQQFPYNQMQSTTFCSAEVQ